MRPHLKSVSLAVLTLFVGTAVLEMTPARSQWPLPSNPGPIIIDIPADQIPIPIPVNPVPGTNFTNPNKVPEFKPPKLDSIEDALPSALVKLLVNFLVNLAFKPKLSKEDNQRYEQWKQACKETQTRYNSFVEAGNSASTVGNLVQAADQLTQATGLSHSPFIARLSNAPYYLFDQCSFNPSKDSVKQKLQDVLVQYAGQLVQRGDLEAAIEKYRQAFLLNSNPVVKQKLQDILLQRADQLAQQGQPEAAIEKYRQAFLLNSDNTEARKLGQQLLDSQPLKAIAYFKIALEATVKPSEQLDLVLGLGEAYTQIELYQTSLIFYQDATLFFAQKIVDPRRETAALLGQAKVRAGLGQYDLAFDLYQQVYKRNQSFSLVDRNSQSSNLVKIDTLLGFGDISRAQGKAKEAVGFYNQALEIARSVEDTKRVTVALKALGDVQNSPQQVKLQQPSDEIKQSQERLQLAQTESDFLEEIAVLSRLGDKYHALEQLRKLLALYDQTVKKQIKNKDFKEAVETIKKIFALLKANPELVAEFRGRADPRMLRREIGIAIEQGKPCLALELADRLKVVEAEEYFGNQRNIGISVNNSSAKQNDFAEIEALQRTAIQQMQELEKLQQIPEANRTPEQKQRIEELKPAVITLFELFAQFFYSTPVAERVAETNRNAPGEVIRFGNTCVVLEKITKQQKQKVALFYPLLLNDDRLALMLYIPGVGPFYKTAPVNRATLTQEVTEFQSAILAKEKNFNLPDSKMRQSAQQMYRRLLEPFEPDLRAANVKTIIYASDDILRYVPLAALHDGSQWLIERYEIQYIVASSLTDFNTPPKRDRKVLAGAFVNGEVKVNVGKQPTTYTGLPSAKPEIDNLKARIPNTTQLIDANFSPEVVRGRKERYTMMHFATHASFGRTPDDSYIVFGKGHSTLVQIGEWNLKNIDLLTLGACATAFGGQLGDGREILGFGYQTHRAGAKATLASLWAVQDDSTQVLMDRFYAALSQGKPKVVSIRQAQLELLSGKPFATPHQQGTQTASIKDTTTPNTAQRFDHPYYWAPFILIGNGL